MTTCSACGQPVGADLSFCTACGQPVGTVAPGAPTPADQPSQPPTQPPADQPSTQAAQQWPASGSIGQSTPGDDPTQQWAPTPSAGPSTGPSTGPGATQWAPPQAGQQGQPSGVPGQWAAPGASGASGGEAPQFWQQAPQKRSRGPLIAALALVVAAVAVGGFAIWKVFFSSDTGADSPEEAVTELLEATADQDGVAALRMLNPDEVRGADEVYDSLRKRLDDADITEDGEVTGAGFDVEGLEVEVEELTDHVAKVTVTGGTITANVTFDDLPEQFADAAEDGKRQYGDTYSDPLDFADFEEQMDAPEKFFMIAIENDGRWYVSPTATIAEWISIAESGEGGDWSAYEDGRGRDPVTADSPEGALGVLADSFALNDLQGFLDALPPGQGDLLRPYAGLLEEEVLNQGMPDIAAEIDARDLEVGDESDGLVRVDLRDVSLKLTDPTDGSGADFSLSGSCGAVVDRYGNREEGCLPEGLMQAADEDNVFVMVRKVDGGWQLDPLATLVGWADVLVANMSGSDAEEFFDLIG